MGWFVLVAELFVLIVSVDEAVASGLERFVVLASVGATEDAEADAEELAAVEEIAPAVEVEAAAEVATIDDADE